MLEHTGRVVLVRNVLHELHILPSVALEGILAGVGVVDIDPRVGGVDGLSVSPELSGDGRGLAVDESLVFRGLDRDGAEPEKGVAAVAVLAHDVSALGDTNVGKDLGDGLPQALGDEVFGLDDGVELLDKGFVQLGGPFDNTGVVLEGQSEPNVAIGMRLA